MNRDSFVKPSIYSTSNVQPQWKFKAKLSHCQIWQNYMDSSIAEAYLLPASYLMKEEKNYGLRKGSGVVESLGFLYLNSCPMKNKDAYVLIERIPNRLAQVNALTQPQSLKVLYSTFRCLETIEKIWGQFQLTENCICFNTKGQVKVWINADLWCNYPEKIYTKSKKTFKERDQELIWRVFKMVEKRSINPNILEPFRKAERQGISSLINACNIIVSIAQNLFLDIGIHEEKTREKMIPKIQLKTELNESEYNETKLNSQRLRISNLRSKQKFYTNTFQSKKAASIQRIKTEWSNAHERISPSRQERTRGFSGYQTLKGNQSEFKLQNEQKKIKKYDSVPSSPRQFNHAFKKKNIDYQDKSTFHPLIKKSEYENLQESIHEQVREEIAPKQSKKDFQTFGLLQGEKDQQNVGKTAGFIEINNEGKKKDSLFDVAKMEEQLMKFDEKRKKQKQSSEKKKRLSLEDRTNQINNSSFIKERFATTMGAGNNFYQSKDFLYPEKERKPTYSFNYEEKDSQQSLVKRQIRQIQSKIENLDQKAKHQRHISQIGKKEMHNRSQRTSRTKYNIYNQAQRQEGEERLTLPRNQKRQAKILLWNR